MARRCELCGKGPISGNRVSHANNHTKRRFYPNLQNIRVQISGGNKRIRICTRCIKLGNFIKAA